MFSPERSNSDVDESCDEQNIAKFDEERKYCSKYNKNEESIHEISDIYGHTPPRTRLHRRQKSRKQKEIESVCKTVKSMCSKTKLRRRYTLDTIIFNEMCNKADKDLDNECKRETVKEGSRKNKRNFKLQRGHERDIKQDIESDYKEKSSNVSTSMLNHIKIETRNRFRCLRSKPVDVESKNAFAIIGDFSPSICNAEESCNVESPKTTSLKERETFHSTFSFLIKLGSSDKERCHRQMSKEETRWQNELKDLIWLELQAYHADCTAMAQDEWLCKQREEVGFLLKEIMEYRYDPMVNSCECATPVIMHNDDVDIGNNSCASMNVELGVCPGCLSMFCRACARAQSEALRQVENLLIRLENAEALYPSSQAFAAHYPLYKSSEFTDRIKAMCLWYNMTKHHRLKLLILGKLLMLLHTKKKPDENTDSGISSKSSDTVDSVELRKSLVRFELSCPEDSSSPSDSNNSNVSYTSSVGGMSFGKSWSSSSEMTNNYEDEGLDKIDFYLMEFDRQTYRKYIEEVLKTKGLRKSLNFLERLHTSVLRKARLALEKTENDNIEISGNEEFEGDQELRRYGVWSREAKDLNLPSYRAAFVFLSRVPLDIVHEFLRMRLEQKPEQPSLLSVRQMMHELREGLKIACLHRDRFFMHSRTAEACNIENGTESMFAGDVKKFDESLKAVFELYLEYLQQWVEMVQHDSFHKNLIMDEWIFVKSLAFEIMDGYQTAGMYFCVIAQMVIKQADEFLIERPKELKENRGSMDEDEDEFSTRLHLKMAGREWQGMFVEAREKVVKSITFARCLRNDIDKWTDYNESLYNSINNLKEAVLNLRQRITTVVENFETDVDKLDEPMTEGDRISFRIRVREILHQAYRMGFEYHKELCKFFVCEERVVLVQGLVSFAFLWMNFVQQRCERGRGLRPRWANQGLDYLNIVCEPLNTKHLTDAEFEELKTQMDRCISHVIGTASKSNPIHDVVKRMPRSRGTSPASRRNKMSISNTSPKVPDTPKLTEANSYGRKNVLNLYTSDNNVRFGVMTSEHNLSRSERIVDAIKKLDQELEEKLKNRELIGQVTDRKSVDRFYNLARRVNFTWQRGIKIGQGRFGKVYTVVNNRTGELLAMKEVQLQPGDHRAIKRVSEELQIFESIQHRHLVRYYGVEIHREEMLIFMEFCAEGTLQSLVVGSGNGLPEHLVRKYAHQLLLAVEILHLHGIVHRDIKTANIFLTDEGNCLKLGDFGSAVQIKAHTTMPGELQGFVGTQAYMAPEVFMKNESVGHGRAADIWSVGCCIVEMASGRRPWSEFDSNYQIMFKVGMGESPQPPKHLSPEGVDFLKKCLQHDAKKRPTANALLSHTFARVFDDVNADLTSRFQTSL